ncbi:MAG: transcriptional regulator, ArsR family [Candidatus Methanoperedens nitroreducens]|uniref:Transcriptional regulator, ArsR family n=1 Tax=Candidatus Methanoperedens nitratireducens TaxID=1392998 RepID=A0A0P8A2R9_9EURY|nr:winged helix-turn-helix domain-containing protein [Candidatus Methanoperedens sp. BLZ2]KAB2947516.1 MAG: winged helix-turn-helix domain-containing protein [Candidatus Methanoperedens sp.]KPQ42391.1 MAG: transcriptional regulator, ArsR family [Candidatus Methanoperedens sp. BLZ1]MBZ0175104.1 winged helix-turn-helix domain-containing protein [Candidatus Methanoperedens nitroreducens]MCX9078669.1 winged helix-turn-helix domain-containing protein [Candidatus Methanoperedens sp.]
MSDLLNIITSSDKRRSLLLLLKDGPKTMGEIMSALSFTKTGMLPQIRILEEKNLVKREGKKYALTRIGQMIIKRLEPLVKTVEVIEKQEVFWQEHDISSIPSGLLMRIDQLGDYQVIESSIEDIYEPHKEFLDNVSKSKKLFGISPIVHPIYPDFFLELAENGTEISLILTQKAFNKIETEYYDKLARGLDLKNLSFYMLDEDIKLTFVVSDIFCFTSFFLKNGVFDLRRSLVSFDKSSLLWGEELFNYYRERSKKIENL